MPSKNAAISGSAIEPRLYAAGFTAKNIRALLPNHEWIALDSRKGQLVFLQESDETECAVRFNSECLVELFELTRSRFRVLLAKARKQRRAPHRPAALSDHVESGLFRMIREKVHTDNYVTKREPPSCIETNFWLSLTSSWIHYFLQRRAAEVRNTIIAPRELPRLQVPRRLLDEFIELIKKCVLLVRVELIDNLDETDLSDLEASKPDPVLVPIDLCNPTTNCPVNHQVRHQRLVCCISRSGDADCPLLVSAKESVSRMFDMNISDGIDLRVEIASSSSIAKESFLRYTRGMLISAIESNRNLPEFEQKPAIVFCDNCFCHVSESVLQR
jgi:hypothetical protein